MKSGSEVSSDGSFSSYDACGSSIGGVWNDKLALKLVVRNQEEESGDDDIYVVFLSDILHDELKKPSFEKLIQQLETCAQFSADEDCASLRLSCLDSDEDTVTITSTASLLYAIQQHEDDKNGSALRVSVDIVWNQEDEEQSQDAECGCEQLIDELDDIHKNPGQQLNAIKRFLTGVFPDDGETMARELDFRLPEAIRLGKVKDINFPRIRFDPSSTGRSKSGLVLDSNMSRVTKKQGGRAGGWRYIHGQEGFSTGRHYWMFRVTKRGQHGNMRIGVSDGKIKEAKEYFPGKGSDTGCSLRLRNGNVYFHDKCKVQRHVLLVKEATTIGVLLDMEKKTVTYYVNGHCAGFSVESDVLTSSTYFPTVVLHENGQSLEIEDLE